MHTYIYSNNKNVHICPYKHSKAYSSRNQNQTYYKYSNAFIYIYNINILQSQKYTCIFLKDSK